MTGPVPWTVVAHAADHSPPTIALGHLVRWLAQRPDVSVRTVVWTAGPRMQVFAGTPVHDVGRVRRWLLPLRMQRLGLRRLGGGLRGRAVRSALKSVPAGGVLYLSTGFAGSVLRYLPPGRRTVVTHVHAVDRIAADHLTAPDRDRLVAGTDRWLATDADVAAWMASAWGISAGTITVVPAPVAVGSVPPPITGDSEELVVAVAGASAWRDGPDHTARLARALHRYRPGARVRFTWIGNVREERELWPIIHDFDRLELSDAFAGTVAPRDPLAPLEGAHLLALTAPDEVCPWPAWEGAARGLPFVCFATHRLSSVAAAGAGARVDYGAVDDMARAILALSDEPAERRRRGQRAKDLVAAERDISLVGPQVLDAGGVAAE